ncbi:MAG: hypothetical protein CVU38_17935 [Chloroflexi bacterium HGW-Chloroflexi-1]|nr:MAG: hypothetical protein CVU38_17935 [Chloroflexi bacterium HGW-Chloroflexi-1]
MRSDDLGLQLHDRVTRGEQLSAEDQARLEAWYAAQDRAEMEQLDLTIAEGKGVYAVGSSSVSGAVTPAAAIPVERRNAVPGGSRKTMLPATFKPQTELGRRLWEIRARIVASGEPLLGWKDIERELAERRGEREQRR